MEEEIADKEDPKKLYCNTDEETGRLGAMKSSMSLKCLAVALAVFSCIVFTINNFLIKSQHLDSVDVLLVRSVTQSLTLFSIAKLTGQSLWPSKVKNVLRIRAALLFASASGSLVIFLTYFAVLHFNLGDAMAIIFSAPVFTIIFEWFFVQKPRGVLVKLAISLLLLFGVFLIIQPPFLKIHDDESVKNGTNSNLESSEQTDELLGGLAALAAAILGGLCNVVAWYSTKDGIITSTTLAAYSGATGLVISLVIGLAVSESDKIMSEEIVDIPSDQWAWIWLVACLSILAFWSQMASLKWISASTLGSIQALEVIFAYFVQVVIMKEPSNALALSGSALVMICVAGISLVEKMYELCKRFQNGSERLVLTANTC